MGGLARRATEVTSLRKNNDAVLLVDAGMAFPQRLEEKKVKAEIVLQVMDYLQYDAFNLGRNEFSLGAAFLETARKDISVPMITSNVVYAEDRARTWGEPYLLKKVGNLQVAILGVQPKDVFGDYAAEFPGLTVTSQEEALNALLSRVRGQKFLSKAPSCILVLVDMKAYDSEEAAYTPYLDAGAAVQNLLLAAHGLGLGACWINFGAKGISPESRKDIHASFGIPADYRIVSLVAVGAAARLPDHPGRKSLSAISAVESFDGPFSPGQT